MYKRFPVRRLVPLLIVVAAIAVYEGRAVLLEPLLTPPASVAPETATGAAMPPADSSVAVEAAVPPPTVTHGRISRGASFFVEMRRSGVDPRVVHDIVQASRKLYNFKRTRPGQKFDVFHNGGGRVDSLHFAIDSESVLRVKRVDDRWVTRRDTVQYRMEHYVTSGTIRNSIFATLQEKGANPELASHLAVIFQWDIDFFKDIRKGDTFTILYENRVYPDGKTRLGHVLAAKIFTRGREHFAVRFKTRDGSESYYDARGRSLQKSLLRAPLRYRRISSNFTHRRLHPVSRTYKPHLGVDYVAPRGTAIRSTGSGTILAATRHGANGNYVKIRHNNRYTTYYLHLQGFARGIRKGVRVKQGQVIGYLGSTGRVTAAHLDYRIKVGDRFVNPRTIRLPSQRPVPSAEKPFFAIARDSFLVRFFEADLEGSCVRVARPEPPGQARLAMVF
ncbi:MAG: peptidoglycan DD-metalloendopeptidase family protein [Candidatus Krumholzibacteriia bacterium]